MPQTKPPRRKPRDPLARKMSGPRWTTVTTLLRIAVAIEDIEERFSRVEAVLAVLRPQVANLARPR
jgi:hypothetical protein